MGWPLLPGSGRPALKTIDDTARATVDIAMRPAVAFLVVAAVFGASLASAVAQRPGAFGESRDHPAISYSKAPVEDAVADLNRRLAAGEAALRYDKQRGGYLASVLEALKIPVESQILAFAETSQQARRINRGNPRAIYFTDTLSVGWVRGGDMIEIAAQDPRQGTIFYTLAQEPSTSPALVRNDNCLACHLSWDTLAVPGWVLQTVFPRKSEMDYADGGFVDHRMPIEERWGGWFVTGKSVPPRHMGNQPTLQPKPRTGPAQKLTVVDGEFDRTGGYLTGHSDVAALLVLDHQVHAINLITRLGWEARIGGPASRARVEEALNELVDYLLFVDEAPIPGRVDGGSGFADVFAAAGKKDARGRTLRTLRLSGRLMEYPLSYMIDSPQFAALPDAPREAALSRIRSILRDGDPAPKYAHLTPALRKSVLEVFEGTR